MRDYELEFDSAPLLYDNINAINISKNPVQYFRTKHINIRCHFLRDHVEKYDIMLSFMESKYQIANMFTKPLDSLRFAALRDELGVVFPSGFSWGDLYYTFIAFVIYVM